MCIRDSYIADIRESSRLLQVDWSEKQLVDTILVGLSPEAVSYTHLDVYKRQPYMYI